MPCNGVTVLRPISLKANVFREIKAQPEVAINAIKKLLADNWQAEVINIQQHKNATRFYINSGGYLEITADGLIKVAGFWLPQNHFERLAKIIGRLGVLLTQERIRQVIKKIAVVEDEQRAPNGALIINVKLEG